MYKTGQQRYARTALKLRGTIRPVFAQEKNAATAAIINDDPAAMGSI